MKQLNNISTPKGRKVFSRRILFFSFFILAVIALALMLWLKRTVDQEIKQDNIEKEITTEKEKDGVRNLHKKYKGNGICLGRLAARSLDERFLYGISGIDLLGRDI